MLFQRQCYELKLSVDSDSTDRHVRLDQDIRMSNVSIAFAAEYRTDEKAASCIGCRIASLGCTDIQDIFESAQQLDSLSEAHLQSLFVLNKQSVALH